MRNLFISMAPSRSVQKVKVREGADRKPGRSEEGAFVQLTDPLLLFGPRPGEFAVKRLSPG
jgi:hypothetical protein